MRTPIVVDLSEVDFRNFFENAANRAAFPVLNEMGPEIAEFNNTGGLVSEPTRQKLEAVRALAEPLTNDPDLNDPNNAELREMFGIGLDPTRQTFRTLVEEYLKLYPGGDVTVGGYYDIAADFWRDKLELEVDAINAAQLAAQQELNQAVRQLVRDAFLGDEGFASKALGLATDLKKISIDNQIAELQEKLASAPDDDKPAIEAQIAKLNDWKTRLG